MAINPEAPDFEETMRKAQERLDRMQQELKQATEPDAPALDTAVPIPQTASQGGALPEDYSPGDVSERVGALDLQQNQPSPEEGVGPDIDFDAQMALAKTQLSNQQEEAGMMREDDKNWFTDLKTTAKLAALYPVAGKLGRGETEMGLRELTKNLVWEQLADEDQAQIEASSGMKIDEMKWNHLNRALDKSLGRERLRSMMGFREGDQNEASGAPAFPMAFELIAGSLNSGTLNFYEHFIRPVFSDDTPELSEEMIQAVQETAKSYTADTKASVDKTMVAEDAEWFNPFTWFDESTKDPYHDLKGFLHTTFQQSGNLLAMAVAARTGGRVGASRYTKSLATSTSTVAEIQALQKTGAVIGGAAAGGKAEMSLIRDGVFGEVNQRIQKDLPEEVWANNDHYQQLIGGGLTSEEAKQIIAYSHANNAGDMAMVISGAMMGSPMGAFYGSMTGRSAGRQLAKESIMRQMGRGALYETGQEMGQELSEAVIGNLGIRSINPDQDLWEGGLEAVMTAFFISAGPGALGGIRSERGAGIAAERDRMIRKSQQWVNASNERWKHQNKIGPNTSFDKDASPQDQLKAMIELERLQKKEAEEFMKIRGELRTLMEESGVDNDALIKFDAKSAGYETDLGLIAKQQKRRTSSRKEARKQKQIDRERADARKQVERDVTTINENMNLVEDMLAVQRGEGLSQEGYDNLAKLDYGTYTGKGDSNFVLTKRGTRAMQELSAQAGDLRHKIDSGFTGSERREDTALRESMASLSDEEFETQVMRDPVTNLWNNRKWKEDAGKANAVAFLDADSLKWVNDNMSHSAGTTFLKTITRELEELGNGIESYRYGGDEFVVTGPDRETLQQVVESALGRISKAKRIEEGGQSVKPTLSVGYGSSFEEADIAMNEDKDRRYEAGERMDSRKDPAGTVPPSFKAVGDAKSPQMTLFAMGGNKDLFNDDEWTSDNKYMEDYWNEYVRASDRAYTRRFKNITEVEEEQMRWIEEVADGFLPSTNTNNPPVSIVHDDEWLRIIDKERYDEIADLPFGSVRGLFSMDAPSHGVYLIADVIVSEAKAKLRLGNRITTWNAAKYRITEGDQVELINNETGKIERGVVEKIKKETYKQPTATQGEKRLLKETLKLRQKLNKLQEREDRLMKQVKRMKPEKRRDRQHPINRNLSNTLDEIGIMHLNLNRSQTSLQRERQKRWGGSGGYLNTKDDEIHVRRGKDLLIFDPNENAILEAKRESDKSIDVSMGQFRSKVQKNWSSKWHSNLGNIEAAQDEELTKEMVQEVAADTLMHETVGHFGIRGLTKDWDNYLKLTHAIADAFPEVVSALRMMGYNYRDDINRGDELNAQNKALLGEEVLAWVAGSKLGKLDMEGMTLPQKNAIQRFISWFKQQLVRLGYNRYYRRRMAAQIRSARNKMYNAKTDAARDAAWESLYGEGGLVHVSPSGVRTGKYSYGKKVKPPGHVVKAARGFLNDDDLMSIIARSHDFIRNGKTRWQFKDHAGAPHWLPMRDTQIFRKPVWDVMANGMRPRSEEERLTAEEEAYEEIVLPTTAEVYQQITGEVMPEGWKPITPGDFRDEAKRIQAEMSEGKTADEIKQMKKDKLFPNPKQLYDKATEGQVGGDVSGQVKSALEKAVKEKQRVEQGIKSKQTKIEQLELLWGKAAVRNDQIPIFPEIGTIEEYFDALRRALPSAKGPGYISPMEVEASGFNEQLWPSRLNYIFNHDMLSGEDLTNFRNETGIKGERMTELAQPYSQLTKKEAAKVAVWVQKANKQSLERNNGLAFPREWEDAALIEQNNALTLNSLTAIMGQYGLSQQSPTLATLAILYGENHALTQEYKQALVNTRSADPDKITAATVRMLEIMETPIDTSKLRVTKEWVMQRLEKPAYHVEVGAPRQVTSWQDHYERITGETPDSDWYDLDGIKPRPVRELVRREIGRDIEEGPDIGFDPTLNRWITFNADPETGDYLEGLMPGWANADKYKAFVFWQTPKGPVRGGHFGYAEFHGKDTGYANAAVVGHARVTEADDADPNAPTAPNPEMQGKFFVNYENQSDWAQDASKKYGSQEELDAAALQHALNGMALEQHFHQIVNSVTGMVIDLQAQEIEDFKASDQMEGWLNSRFGKNVVDNFDENDRAIAEELVAIVRIYSTGGSKAQQNMRTAFTNISDGHTADQQPLEKAAAGYQPLARGKQQEVDITFLGDARIFEWLDHRAMATIGRNFNTLPLAVWEMAEAWRNITPEMAEWKKLREHGGLMNMLRSATEFGASRDGDAGSVRRKMNTVVNRMARSHEGNKPAHRLPVMRDLAEGFLTDWAKRTTWGSDDEIESTVKSIFDEAAKQSLMRVRIPYKEWADVAGIGYDALYTAIDGWAANTKDFGGVPKTLTETDDAITLELVGHADALMRVQDGLTDSVRKYLEVKLDEGDIDYMEGQLREKNDHLTRNWDYGLTEMNHWRDEFNIQLASVRITQDPNAPFELENEETANGLDVETSKSLMASHDIETFEKYVDRRWKYIWSRAGEDGQAAYIDAGGSEETADPSTMESFAAQYNDKKPGIYMMQIPVAWDDENNATEKKNFYIKRVKTGDDWMIEVDGEVWRTGLDRYDIENWFSGHVREWYSENGLNPLASNFQKTRDLRQGLQKEIADLEEKIAEDKGVVEGKVAEMFSDESLLPTYSHGEFSDLAKTFLDLIDDTKKSGWQQQTLIEKNEQWRVTQMLWSISEAVRNGYSRIALISGDSSGKRGGFMQTTSGSSYSYYHHADKIEYSLEQQQIRGETRDILTVKANNVEEPMWIDVTEDSLLPLNPDRSMKDTQVDPLEGYMSAPLTKQLGRDVAELIGTKLKRSVEAPKAGRLLISKRDTGSELLESWFVHDTSGNVHGVATSEDEANTIREELKEKAVSQSTLRGTINKSETGGPIMFLMTQYVGGPMYTYGDSSQYQHTVARPTLEGGRGNYDIVLLSRYRGHLKKFGLDIEEGQVKVPVGMMEDLRMAEGARQKIFVPETIAQAHPNIRIEEVSGENYGFIINSDNGIVLPHVFSDNEAAEKAYGEWLDDNSVGADGAVKVYQITINDELRKYHEKPINPFLNVNYQAKSNPVLEEALSKVGSNKPSLKDRYTAWKQSWKASFNVGTFDRFYGILHAMRATGQGNLAAEDSPYIQARMTTGIDSIMRGVMEYGSPVWREGVVENEGKGLLKILEPVGDNIELWAGYMAGVRAKRLLAEGKEQLFEPQHIDELVALGEQFPIFKEVAADYAAFNKKMLDFAEESGVINAETRPLWESADYIPFYRIVDDRLVGPLAKGVGIANQQSPIKTLKGGSNNLGDLVHNIFINATRLMDASIKNNAALMAVDALEPTGIIRNETHKFSRELIPMEQVGKILKQNGIDIASMPDEVTKGLQVMFALQAPKGDGVISVLRNGKKEYYFTEDELLYRSLTSLNMKAFGAYMSLLRAPKRLLTTWVTLDPGFMVANFVRDSMSAFVLSRDHFVPLHHGLKGFAEAITEGETMRAMIGSGAAFDSGFINQGDPKSTHRYIKRAMKDAGFQRTLLNTPRKLFEAYKRLGSAAENANRVAVYEAAIRAGKSKAQAAFESKDLMDFSMGGDWPFIQFLIQTVPFMGARMQGLHRLGRGAAEHPVAFTMKGAMVGLAGMALWFAFREDERYKELEDWDKDTYFHWWIGDTHYRLPKGFEVGAIFNTIPERIFEYMYSQENDAGKYLLRRFGFMIAETFNMNPIPQAARPLIESLANYNFFRGRSIESPWEQEKLPEDRYKYYTSPTMIELADALPEGLNTVMNGKIKSPLHLQNIYSGYTGTLGRYFLMAADVALRQTGNYPVPPEMRVADYPVIGRFYRGEGPRRTRYEEEFYRELDVVQQVMGSFKAAEDADDEPRLQELEARYAPHMERAQEFENYRREISKLNKEVREIYMDDSMTRADKRKEIDEIQAEKNAVFKEAYDDRPGAVAPDSDDISTLMDGFDPSTPDGNSDLKEQAPQTAALFNGVVGMSDAQLNKLAKSGNYQPRGR